MRKHTYSDYCHSVDVASVVSGNIWRSEFIAESFDITLVKFTNIDSYTLIDYSICDHKIKKSDPICGFIMNWIILK